MKFISGNSGIQVVNRRKDKEDLYIGRGSPLGNPFIIGKDGDRDEVIAKYKDYLVQQVNQGNQDIIRALMEIRDRANTGTVKLGCYCSPYKCHGDIIKEYLELFGDALNPNSKDTPSEVVVSFTGHRPPKIGGYSIPNPTWEYLVDSIAEKLEELKPVGIITGMALGVDSIAAEIAIELGIPFIAAVPFKGQECKWPKPSQEKYHYLLSKAFEVVYVSEPGYAPWKMQTRNQWMVDNSSHLIAVWDGSAGGTGNCVSYAQSKGTRIIRIDPTHATR